MTRRVALLGATGFVGQHVGRALTERGACVIPVTAPRSEFTASARETHFRSLTAQLTGCDVIVNAAGVADAGGSTQQLTLGNHRMPDLLGLVATHLRLRLVHVSSAAVQGRALSLDSSKEYDEFSPYASSKAEGERALLRRGGSLCIYRPPGVHGRERTVTRTLARLARSPLASVAAPGTSNTPQALIENVADAIAFLATIDRQPPLIVHHPTEGLTTSSLLTALAGHPPHHVQPALARSALRGLYTVSRARPGLEGHVRRLEMLWFGQEQATSWLTRAGWRPPRSQIWWQVLGREVRNDLQQDRHPTRDKSHDGSVRKRTDLHGH